MKHKVNEIQISYSERVNAKFWPKIKSSKDSAEILFERWNKNTIGLQESFYIIVLNNSNKVKFVQEISKGGITSTIIDFRILFALVLKSLGVAIILAHNHPSGGLKPSGADKAITKDLKKASSLLGLRLLDHLIITPNGEYYSFADNGIL